MSNLLPLTKVLIKNNVFAFSSKKKKGKSSSTSNAVFFFIIMAIAIASVAVPAIMGVTSIMKEINVSELLLSFVVPIGAYTSIIFGIFSIISVFYFNKDSEQLLPLPIKSGELLFAKFIAAIVSEYLLLLMFIFPIIIGVGIGASASFIYYLYSTIILILMPIIPSVLMSIIIMLINKIFKFSAKKDVLMYVMTGFIIVAAMGYSFGIEAMFGNESSLVSILGGDTSGFIKISKWLFPFSNSASYALIRYQEFIGFASLMTYIGITMLFMAALYFFGELLYIKNLTKGNDQKKSKTKALDEKNIARKGSTMAALISKEWITIRRTPVFMLNTVIMSLLLPVIFGISFAISYASAGASLNELRGVIPFDNGGILVAAFGALLIFCSMAASSSSAISREGSGAWMMKTIPVSLKKQLDAKVYFSFIIDIITAVVVELLLWIALRPPLIYLLLINIPLVFALLISNYISIFLDLRKPRLDWKDENEAVKQNLSVLFATIVNIVVSGLFIALGVMLLQFNLNVYLVFGLLSALVITAYVVLMVIIKKNEVKLFSRVC